ncbi:hypothetical protein SAMN02745165_01017 [Malonomonas rubra DSM 5091]|uniref:Response regulatory domain-containing protein n=1 Tax=Malonomonas rubra DSM 5091 TaxID=1122189 RepID=A0A1M6ESJ7_MALRU|nr:hypothetical protein [Malonomonas rubra]SHI88494.1 hypothetical protein SAMN02745165_01017 [Malonomonas rubra DSM 5091]
MSEQSILLFDSSLEKVSSTRFLLQLANYRVAVVRSGEEAFNWLVSRANSSSQASLLVINDHSQSLSLLDLLPQLKQQGVAVPMLSVLRDEIRFSGEDAEFVLCRPENLLGQVRALTT